MNPFHYEKNYFSDEFLAQQVTWEFGLFLLSLVVLMIGLVLIRRAFGLPRRSSAGTPPPAGAANFERYEIGARLWHVGLVGILGALWISGAAFYMPGIIPGPVPVLGISWLIVHLAFGVFFMLGLVVHMIKAPIAGGRTMWFERGDGHQLAQSVRYYLGLDHEQPKLGKYAVVSKMFHILLILLTVIMLISGISLSLGSLGWADVDQEWQRWQRLLHDIGSYGFLVLVVGHVFWQLLKRWSQQKAMVTGTISAATFKEHHDWDRWKPDVVSHTSDAEKNKHGK
jgi:cytochrome b subunit of formate dehydrogenase